MINDRLHDKLQQLAHGELDSREEAAVRAQIAGNPEAQDLLAQYSQLKSDMSLLQEIPPDQLSKERLRARLLGEALKPERSKPIWTWFWMPTLAAALAFVVFFNRTKATVAPQVIGSGSVAKTTTPSGGDGALTTPFKLSPPNTQNLVASKAPAPVTPDVITEPRPVRETLASNEAAPSRHMRRHSRDQKPNVATAAGSGPGVFEEAANTAVNALAMVAPKETALADSAAPHSDDSVVVISNNVDADTGAQHATEETASNVLGGG